MHVDLENLLDKLAQLKHPLFQGGGTENFAAHRWRWS